MNLLSALPIDWPFELMISAITVAAPDRLELELFEDTVREVVAPDPGP